MFPVSFKYVLQEEKGGRNIANKKQINMDNY